MKIYISADMEGATGVTDVWQTSNNRPEYAFGCKMQLHDVRAAIEGAFAGGADEVLVNDAHGRKINLDINGLGTKVRLLSGTPKPLGMMEGSEGADGVFFIGYHAMAGSPIAVLDHTISGATVFSISLNGEEIGEMGLKDSLSAIEIKIRNMGHVDRELPFIVIIVHVHLIPVLCLCSQKESGDQGSKKQEPFHFGLSKFSLVSS